MRIRELKRVRGKKKKKDERETNREDLRKI